MRSDDMRMKIMVAGQSKMTRGEYAARAVHVALQLRGVHHGGPIVVLGTSKTALELNTEEDFDPQVRITEPFESGRSIVMRPTAAGAMEDAPDDTPLHLKFAVSREVAVDRFHAIGESGQVRITIPNEFDTMSPSTVLTLGTQQARALRQLLNDLDSLGELGTDGPDR